MMVSLIITNSIKPVPIQSMDNIVNIVGIVGCIVLLLALCMKDEGGK